MDDTWIKLIVHKKKTIFDNIIITPLSTFKCDQTVLNDRIKQQGIIDRNTVNKHLEKIQLVCLNNKGYNSYLVSAFVVTLINSHVYHYAVYQKLSRFLACKFPTRIEPQVICIKLRTPRKQFLDYNWNEKITQMVLERREVDHAMSWLSTLGGAFSALGDEFEHCAEMAGKISLKQFKLALRLGDPLLVARCKLYAALSFIQRGQLRISRTIIKNIYKFAITQKDIRLQNMCRGIWAKLVYCYKMRKQRNLRMLR